MRPFPGNEAHQLFSGAPKLGVLDGGQTVYAEKVDVFFCSLEMGQRRKINPKSLWPVFSLCRHAGIDAALVRAHSFISQVHPPSKIELNKKFKTLRWRRHTIPIIVMSCLGRFFLSEANPCFEVQNGRPRKHH